VGDAQPGRALDSSRRCVGNLGVQVLLKSEKSVLGKRRRRATRGYDSLLTLARLLGIHQAPFIQQRHSVCSAKPHYAQPLASRFAAIHKPAATLLQASSQPKSRPCTGYHLCIGGASLLVCSGNLLTRFHRQERPLHLDSANTFSANHGAPLRISVDHALESLSPSPSE
jgi:hypothetical protein